jgi:hypothetical protein
MEFAMFKIADLFPIQKGHLCKYTDEANERYKQMKTRTYLDTEDQVDENHPAYNKILIVIDNMKIDNRGHRYCEVFVQELGEYMNITYDHLQRILT